MADDAEIGDSADNGGTCLPLFPLPDVVHFPRTELRLQITEPRYKRLVLDLMERREEDARWIGVVLLKPGWVERYEGRPEVFPGGTAGKLLDVDLLPDGRANILLYGDYRFELKRELQGGEYRQAVVRPIEEPWLNEKDAGIVAVRHGILENLEILAAELGDKFPFQPGETEGLGEEDPFEELVNRIAADIDVPALRKLQLLIESLPSAGSRCCRSCAAASRWWTCCVPSATSPAVPS